MRLIQCLHEDRLHAALVEDETTVRLADADTYHLACDAMASGRSFVDVVEARLTDTRLDYAELIEQAA